VPDSYAWFLALRYLLTRAIHSVALLGVAVAVWALVLVIAVFSGMVSEIYENVHGSAAELVIQEVREPTSYAAVQELVEADPDVLATAPRLAQVGVYVPRARFPAGTGRPAAVLEQRPQDHNFAIFVGIDPVKEAATTELTRWLDAVKVGRLRVEDVRDPFAVSAERQENAARLMRTFDDDLFEDARDGCALSESRFMALATGPIPGQRLSIVGALAGGALPRPAGGHGSLKFNLHASGAYTTPYKAIESSYILMPIGVLREALGYDKDLIPGRGIPLDVVSEVAVRAKPGADLVRLAARLAPEVERRFGGKIQNWREQHATYLSAVEHERALMKVALFVVLLVAAFLIYAMLHMMVMQKWKDIGILTALGATPRGIAAIFVLCGLLVALAGSALGAALGVLSARVVDDVDNWFAEHWHVSLFPGEIFVLAKIPYSLEPGWIAQVVIATTLLACLVSWLPARRAARLSPIEALAHE
jgi:lipoprotein-releasing system permease protein